MRSGVFFSVGLVAAASAIASSAAADTSRMPARYAERPLVVPQHTLRIDGGPRWPLPNGQIVHTVVDNAEDAFVVYGGASFGATGDLDLGVAVPLTLSPDLDVLDPLFHGTYRLIRGDLELGLFAALPIPVQNEFVMLLGVPVQVGLGTAARIDTGGFLQIDPGDRTDLVIPLAAGFNLSPTLFLGPEAAFYLDDFDNARLLFGFFVGHTIASGGSVLGDLSFRFRMPDADQGLDLFQLIFAADLYFDL